MSDKLEKEINLYDKIIVKNYNDLSLAEQFEKGAVVKTDDELDIVKQQLAIAVEALEWYADRHKWQTIPFLYRDNVGHERAEKTLQQIKELNK